MALTENIESSSAGMGGVVERIVHRKRIGLTMFYEEKDCSDGG